MCKESFHLHLEEKWREREERGGEGMEGRLGFLTKARRELPDYNENPVGPGEYSHSTQENNFRPNFAPFCTTSSESLSLLSLSLTLTCANSFVRRERADRPPDINSFSRIL